jgi:hypothetical protein
MAKLDCSQKYDHAWYESQSHEARLALTTAFLARLEAGKEDAVYASFAQRLDYVRELAGIGQQKDWYEKTEDDNKKWPEMVSVTKGTLCKYLGNEEVDINKVEEEPHVLALIAASGQDVELPWVLWGSGKRDGLKNIRARAKWTLKNYFGTADFVGKAKRKEIYLGDDLIDADQASDNPRYQSNLELAKKIAEMVGPAISVDWLLTGEAQPPERIRVSLAELRADEERWAEKLEPLFGPTLENVWPGSSDKGSIKATEPGQPQVQAGGDQQKPLPPKRMPAETTVKVSIDLKILVELWKVYDRHAMEVPEDMRGAIDDACLSIMAWNQIQEPMKTKRGKVESNPFDEARRRDLRFVLLGIEVMLLKRQRLMRK